MKNINLLIKKSIFIIICLSVLCNAFAQVISNNGAVVLISSGLVVSSGSFENNSGTFTNNGILMLKDNWMNNGGTVSPGTGTAIFNGTVAQTIGGTQSTAFYNLTLSGSGTKTLLIDATVAGTLDIGGTSEFVIPPAKSMTVAAAGSITNSVGDDGILIESTSAGTGNLVDLSGSSVNGIVQRYLTGDSVKLPTHYISSPINASPYSNIWSSGDYNVYYYDETIISSDLDQGWTRILSGTLDDCKGFTVVGKTTVTRTFSGTLNSSSINAPVNYTATPIGGGWTKGIDPQGWNLIGNPFPCSLAITGNGFLNYNGAKLDPSFVALYFWDDPAGSINRADYSSYNYLGGTYTSSSSGHIGPPGNFIPVGQGFFIKLKDSLFNSVSVGSYSTNLIFNPNQKISNNSSQYFISDPNKTRKIWLDVTDTKGLFNEILIGFLPAATKGLDPGLDAIKLKANSNIALYSILGNMDLIIQGLPPITKEMIVPIGLDILNAGELTFSVRQKENFTNEKVYLKDIKENKLVDLNTDTFYTFSTDAGNIRSRFELVFAADIVSIEPNDVKPEVYSSGNTIFIKKPDNKALLVQVYDILGKKVNERNLSGIGLSTISVSGSQGYYFVKISGINTNFTKKLFLK